MSEIVAKHFNHVATSYDFYKKKNAFYYQNLKKLLSELIPRDKVVLEIGCGTGDLLASLKPKKGYGIDISSEMIKIAKQKHSDKKNLSFSTKQILAYKNKQIDYIFMSDVIEHLPKPNQVFKDIQQVMSPNTIFVNTMANPLWEPLLMIAEAFELKMPEGEHNRYPYKQILKMLRANRFHVLAHGHKLLFPKKVPFLTNFLNQYLEPYLKPFAFIEYIVCNQR